MDGTLQWEQDIENRVFTAEGTELRLDDGEFNVQKKRALKADFSASATRRQRLVSLAVMDIDSPIDSSSCIYVVTYRLPVVASHDPITGRYDFEWMSFAADDPARENKGVLRSTSRHGLYIIENLRALRSRCKVSHSFSIHPHRQTGCVYVSQKHDFLMCRQWQLALHLTLKVAGVVCGRSCRGRSSRAERCSY
jgi:hypothetical protein